MPVQSPVPLLCLACSSSLPPSRARKSEHSNNTHSEATFFTQCCNRPICPACLSSNPRLARYNPCLRCLGGAGVVTSRSQASGSPAIRDGDRIDSNVDGAVRDEDVFVLGDDEPEEDGGANIYQSDSTFRSESAAPVMPPPGYRSPTPKSPAQFAGAGEYSDLKDVEATGEIIPEKNTLPALPTKYYIKPGDTLMGIALKYAIDGRLLCRLNSLPPSTLNTTPHLLHTRTVLTLPPTSHTRVSPSDKGDTNPEDPEYTARRAREQAERRLQKVTKEVDLRVARAYVALADTEDEEEELDKKEGSSELAEVSGHKYSAASGIAGEGSIEARAIDRYLDDDEWEARERREGRGLNIPSFPLFAPKA